MMVVVTLGVCLVCAQFVSGCAVFPAAIIPGFSQYKQSLAQTDLPGLAHREDVIDIASHVGESLGYKVSLKTNDTVILLYNPPEYREHVTGESQSVRIFVYKVKALTQLDLPQSKDKDLERVFRKLMPTGLKDGEVHVAVYDSGGYLAGTQENVDKIMGEFKTELLRQTSGPLTGTPAS
jgi:hypothetical protein